jgi:signal transduction histidine kinase
VASVDHPRTRDWPAPASWAPDLVGAAIATGLMVLISSHLAPSGDDRAMDGLGIALVVAGGGSLVLCRRRPRLVLGIVVVVLGTYVGRRYPEGPVFAAGWVALFVASWRTDRRFATIGAGTLCGVLGVIYLLAVGRVVSPVPLIFVAWSAVAALLGDALRTRRGALDELQERAHYLERTREEEARRRVAEDRLGIARDLHDSVAHAMATINVQSGVAAHLLDRDPSQARGALEAIRAASSHTLDELGAIVGVLRDPRTAAPRTPVSTLADVEALVVRSRADGLAVTADVRGTVESVAPSVSAAAYRVVQEALTNVRRHAGGVASAELDVVVGDGGAVRVSVRDDGRGSGVNGSTTGFGLIGMRERVEATGGLLQTGPRPGGGFEVVATWNGRP